MKLFGLSDFLMLTQSQGCLPHSAVLYQNNISSPSIDSKSSRGPGVELMSVILQKRMYFYPGSLFCNGSAILKFSQSLIKSQAFSC